MVLQDRVNRSVDMMQLGLAVKEFITATNWLLDVLRQHKPLTETEEHAVDAKIHTLLLEWDTWKRWNDEQKQPEEWHGRL